ncbi:hypothetical protein DKM44_02345 [Deinococcus irradiatisoli]|uniref:Uncharacterized protein n=1 Tax=Deinococcus irradiatisoli TaxID=2202254 RepID=A0A2Z3JAT2_9DEIO|nr:hypothetical protein [Deinococcus irradiatisoli]AWN22217.1 hypothetical protein DKM44_02345 [Deinococcus irradiatisoli]
MAGLIDQILLNISVAVSGAAGVNNLTGNIGGLNAGLLNLSAGLNVVQQVTAGVGQMVGQLTTWADAANKAATNTRVFGLTVAKFGIDIDQANGAAQRLADQFGVSVTDIQDSMTTLIRVGFTNMGQLEAVMRGAGASAIAAGRDAKAGFSNIADAAATGMSAQLNSIGIAQNLSTYNDKLAKSLGKTTDALTSAQKAQALYNLVTDATGTEVEALGSIQNGYVKSQQAVTLSQQQFSVQLGQITMPLVQRFNELSAQSATFFTSLLKTYADGGDVIGQLSQKYPVLGSAVKAVGDIFAWTKDNAGALVGGLTGALLPGVISVAGGITAALLPALAAGAAALWALLAPVAPFIAAGALIGLVVQRMGIGFDDVKRVAGQVGSGLAQIAAQIPAAWQRAQAALTPTLQTLRIAFGNALRSVEEVINQVLIPLWNSLAPKLQGPAEAAQGVVQGFGTFLKGVFEFVVNGVSGLINGVSSLIDNVFIPLWQRIGPAVQAALEIVLGLIKGAFTLLGGAFKSLGQLLSGNWQGAWDTIKSTVSNAWASIADSIANAWPVIKNQVDNLAARISMAFQSGLAGLKSILLNALASMLEWAAEKMPSVLQSAALKAAGAARAAAAAVTGGPQPQGSGVLVGAGPTLPGQGRVDPTALPEFAGSIITQAMQSRADQQADSLVDYCDRWVRDTLGDAAPKVRSLIDKLFLSNPGPGGVASAQSSEKSLEKAGLTKKFTSVSDLKPGDTVFYTENGQNHTGIYLGNGVVRGNNRVTYQENGGRFGPGGINSGAALDTGKVNPVGNVDINRLGNVTSFVRSSDLLAYLQRNSTVPVVITPAKANKAVGQEPAITPGSPPPAEVTPLKDTLEARLKRAQATFDLVDKNSKDYQKAVDRYLATLNNVQRLAYDAAIKLPEADAGRIDLASIVKSTRDKISSLATTGGALEALKKQVEDAKAVFQLYTKETPGYDKALDAYLAVLRKAATESQNLARTLPAGDKKNALSSLFASTQGEIDSLSKKDGLADQFKRQLEDARAAFQLVSEDAPGYQKAVETYVAALGRVQAAAKKAIPGTKDRDQKNALSDLVASTRSEVESLRAAGTDAEKIAEIVRQKSEARATAEAETAKQSLATAQRSYDLALKAAGDSAAGKLAVQKKEGAALEAAQEAQAQRAYDLANVQANNALQVALNAAAKGKPALREAAEQLARQQHTLDLQAAEDARDNALNSARDTQAALLKEDEKGQRAQSEAQLKLSNELQAQLRSVKKEALQQQLSDAITQRDADLKNAEGNLDEQLRIEQASGAKILAYQRQLAEVQRNEASRALDEQARLKKLSNATTYAGNSAGLSAANAAVDSATTQGKSNLQTAYLAQLDGFGRVAAQRLKDVVAKIQDSENKAADDLFKQRDEMVTQISSTINDLFSSGSDIESQAQGRSDALGMLAGALRGLLGVTADQASMSELTDLPTLMTKLSGAGVDLSQVDFDSLQKLGLLFQNLTFKSGQYLPVDQAKQFAAAMRDLGAASGDVQLGLGDKTLSPTILSAYTALNNGDEASLQAVNAELAKIDPEKYPSLAALGQKVQAAIVKGVQDGAALTIEGQKGALQQQLTDLERGGGSGEKYLAQRRDLLKQIEDLDYQSEQQRLDAAGASFQAYENAEAAHLNRLRNLDSDYNAAVLKADLDAARAHQQALDDLELQALENRHNALDISEEDYINQRAARQLQLAQQTKESAIADAGGLYGDPAKVQAANDAFNASQLRITGEQQAAIEKLTLDRAKQTQDALAALEAAGLAQRKAAHLLTEEQASRESERLQLEAIDREEKRAQDAANKANDVDAYNQASRVAEAARIQVTAQGAAEREQIQIQHQQATEDALTKLELAGVEQRRSLKLSDDLTYSQEKENIQLASIERQHQAALKAAGVDVDLQNAADREAEAQRLQITSQGEAERTQIRLQQAQSAEDALFKSEQANLERRVSQRLLTDVQASQEREQLQLDEIERQHQRALIAAGANVELQNIADREAEAARIATTTQGEAERQRIRLQIAKDGQDALAKLEEAGTNRQHTLLLTTDLEFSRQREQQQLDAIEREHQAALKAAGVDVELQNIADRQAEAQRIQVTTQGEAERAQIVLQRRQATEDAIAKLEQAGADRRHTLGLSSDLEYSQEKEASQLAAIERQHQRALTAAGVDVDLQNAADREAEAQRIATTTQGEEERRQIRLRQAQSAEDALAKVQEAAINRDHALHMSTDLELSQQREALQLASIERQHEAALTAAGANVDLQNAADREAEAARINATSQGEAEREQIRLQRQQSTEDALAKLEEAAADRRHTQGLSSDLEYSQEKENLQLASIERQHQRALLAAGADVELQNAADREAEAQSIAITTQGEEERRVIRLNLRRAAEDAVTALATAQEEARYKAGEVSERQHLEDSLQVRRDAAQRAYDRAVEDAKGNADKLAAADLALQTSLTQIDSDGAEGRKKIADDEAAYKVKQAQRDVSRGQGYSFSANQELQNALIDQVSHYRNQLVGLNKESTEYRTTLESLQAAEDALRVARGEQINIFGRYMDLVANATGALANFADAMAQSEQVYDRAGKHLNTPWTDLAANIKGAQNLFSKVSAMAGDVAKIVASGGADIGAWVALTVKLVSSIADAVSGFKKAHAEVAKLRDDFADQNPLLNPADYQKTFLRSRGFLADLFGGGPEVVQEIDKVGLKAAQGLATGVYNGIDAGFKKYLETGNFDDFAKALQTSVMDAAKQGMVDAFKNDPERQAAFGGAIKAYTDALASKDPTRIASAFDGLKTAVTTTTQQARELAAALDAIDKANGTGRYDPAVIAAKERELTQSRLNNAQTLYDLQNRSANAQLDAEQKLASAAASTDEERNQIESDYAQRRLALNEAYQRQKLALALETTRLEMEAALAAEGITEEQKAIIRQQYALKAQGAQQDFDEWLLSQQTDIAVTLAGQQRAVADAAIQAAKDAAAQQEQTLSSWRQSLVGGIQAMLTGDSPLQALYKGVRDRIGQAIQDGFIAKRLLSQLDPLFEQLDAALSNGLDGNSLIQQIGAALPGLQIQLQTELSPLISALNSAIPDLTKAVNGNTAALREVQFQSTTIVSYNAPPPTAGLRGRLPRLA